MESPVCTPIGSIFSIEQTIMQLSFLSLITSISYSFHPISDSSTKTSLIGDKDNPFFIIVWYSLTLFAVPPPAPPKVNEGLIIIGKLRFLRAFSDSFKFLTINPLGVSIPIFFIAFLKSSLSSALLITFWDAPINLTLNLFNIFFFSSSMDKLRAVCPPIVESKASGLSLSIILVIVSISRGSM